MRKTASWSRPKVIRNGAVYIRRVWEEGLIKAEQVERVLQRHLRMVRHGCYITFQMAEVAVSGRMVGRILARIARLRAPPVPV